jgi:hypothetical protein
VFSCAHLGKAQWRLRVPYLFILEREAGAVSAAPPHSADPQVWGGLLFLMGATLKSQLSLASVYTGPVSASTRPCSGRDLRVRRARHRGCDRSASAIQRPSYGSPKPVPSREVVPAMCHKPTTARPHDTDSEYSRKGKRKASRCSPPHLRHSQPSIYTLTPALGLFPHTIDTPYHTQPTKGPSRHGPQLPPLPSQRACSAAASLQVMANGCRYLRANIRRSHTRQPGVCDRPRQLTRRSMTWLTSTRRLRQ